LSLTASDLYRLEIATRSHADSLRRQAECFAVAEAAEVRAHAGTLRQRAEDFDTIGNLLTGIQGNTDILLPMLRDGYTKLAAEHEALKARGAGPDEAAA
jgi:hypothetical protein